MSVSKARIQLISFGLKAVSEEVTETHRVAKLPKADLYLDCRAVADFSGGDVSHAGGEIGTNQDTVLSKSAPAITSFHRIVEDALQWIPARRAEAKDPYKEPFVVACFCAHGIHRSVATKHLLFARLKKAGLDVEMLGK